MRKTSEYNNLPMALVRSDLTEDELSRRAGVSKSSLRRYLRGDNLPNVADAKAIADVLGYTLDDLYGKPKLPEKRKIL